MSQLCVMIIVAILTTVLLFPMNDASVTKCPQWVKLNKSPVCFGARDNKYGNFTYDRNIFVSSIMLVHRSGTVSCDKRHQNLYSFWGCTAHDKSLLTVLTDNQNRILEPAVSAVNSDGWYTLTGYTSSSSILVFCTRQKPHCIHRNTELRLWYGEDLRDTSEGDNDGRVCADVFALLDH